MSAPHFALRVPVLAAALAALVVLSLPVLAQSGDSYDLTWNTVDSGGAMWSTGGSYALGGTLGQPDAGTLAGGGYALRGGFWGGITVHYRIFLPLLMRSD
jgi:hypothetical protein